MKFKDTEPANILIALPNDTLGGAEQFLKMIALDFLNKECRVHVLFLKRSVNNGWQDLEKYDNLSLKFTNATTEKAGIFSFCKNLLSLRKTYFQYVFTSHVHLTGILGLFIKLNLLKKKYFIGRESTSIFLRFKNLKLAMFKMQYRIGYPSLDLLICQTSFMKNQLTNAIPWISGTTKIEVIPNPIDLKSVDPTESPADVPYQNYLISAGRLIPEKGFDILIEAFNKIHAQSPQMKLVILGEGKERNNLNHLIEKNRLGDKVILHGFEPNVYNYFRHADLCVVSSRIEGFPNVLLQMMSQNDKVVSTKCAGGIEDINGVFIAEVNDVVSLTAAIQLCLESDTSSHRDLFDAELNKRSINNFIERVKSLLNADIHHELIETGPS